MKIAPVINYTDRKKVPKTAKFLYLKEVMGFLYQVFQPSTYLHSFSWYTHLLLRVFHIQHKHFQTTTRLCSYQFGNGNRWYFQNCWKFQKHDLWSHFLLILKRRFSWGAVGASSSRGWGFWKPCDHWNDAGVSYK